MLSFILFLIVALFVLQPIISDIIPQFSYYDEIAALLLFVYFIINTVIFKKMKRECIYLFILLTLSIVIGITGNVRSNTAGNTLAVMQDILSNCKLYFIVISLITINISDITRNKISDNLATYIRMFITIMFISLMISLLFNIGVRYNEKSRYGISPFKFYYENPSALNTYCYLVAVVFSSTLYKNGKVRSHSTIYMFMLVTCWLGTLRSRALFFASLYSILYYYIVISGKRSVKFKLYHYLIIIAFAVVLGWDTFEHYFIENSRQARYLLMHGSFEIAKDFLPFGSGFGTFGTEASRTYYSIIYSIYGLSSSWGLSAEKSQFITDQYWFGILGQFGVVGIIIFFLLIIKMYKIVYQRSMNNLGGLFGSLIFIFTTLLGSIAAGTYINASALGSVFVLLLLFNKKNKTCMVL